MQYRLTDSDRQRLTPKLDTDATYSAGIVRWKSNNQVPPDEVLVLALELGKPIDLAACREARSKDLRAFIADYRARRADEPTAEERLEARAAFGEGATVVNVLTGRRWRT